MSRPTRDGTGAEPVARDQVLRHARGQGNINFHCSADHEQDWQPYPVDPYIDRYIHTTGTSKQRQTLFSRDVLRGNYSSTPAASRPGWTQTVEVTEKTVRSPGVL